MDYKSTLNLPQTDFPMRGSLPEREPVQVEQWLKDRIYYRMTEKNRKSGRGRFLLHDGPPYANGNIHIGHVLNKVLKDVVVKHKNMSGVESPYIPGWDCHGLPIELGVEKQLLEQKRDKATMPRVELRQLCRDYAEKYISLQMSQFQRLQIFGDWDQPYKTMDRKYVASIVRELGRCSSSGVLYQGNKPVYWCVSCQTALAEAEIEYAEKKSPSIYVKFDLTRASLKAFPELAKVVENESAYRASILIWTTTPWTLPANLAVALHPELEYVAFQVPALEGNEIWITAKSLQESVQRAAGFDKASAPLLTFQAERLHRQKVRHPFVDRESLIILGEHVTADTGTGAVHTAPGHGVDDYKIGARYGLEIYAPVDHKGLYTAAFPEMQGQFVFKANAPIIENLRESTHLVAHEEIKHSYPHCWRCHSPVIFRATPQWFLGMETAIRSGKTLRQSTEKAIRESEWIPNWGINRILGMIESRPDWCISRQRTWGVPITVFYCEDCGEPKADPAVFEHVANQIEECGPDVWFTEPVEKLLPPGVSCGKCKGKNFRKEQDILDVWFDSGVSHAAVCEARELGWPADLYLEGSDQHRGWFQTSLITAVATRERAPFKTVLTHGFVNDKEGKKMSKSKGNVTSPQDIMKIHGADILRLWVISEDYRNDISFSSESMEHISESYRKIRNTVRFILGNLYDFNPATDLVSRERMGELDRWAISRVSDSLDKVQRAYERYELHTVYQLLVNLCTVDLSAVYFDILKDRLYTAGKASAGRRSSQTALWQTLNALVKSLAPVLSFTAEEIWGYLQKAPGAPDSVFLTEFDFEEVRSWRDEAIETRFAEIWKVRDLALKALEEARQAKLIGHPREARLVMSLEPGLIKALQSTREDLARLFLVSAVEIKAAEGDVGIVGTKGIQVERAHGEKCPRCWVYATTIGQSKEHALLCARCAEAV